VWYDHGSGEGGNLLDLSAKLERYSLREFVENLSKGNLQIHQFSIHQQPRESENKLEILSTHPLENGDLLKYLIHRRIEKEIA
jgi:hypothetical protein